MVSVVVVSLWRWMIDRSINQAPNWACVVFSSHCEWLLLRATRRRQMYGILSAASMCICEFVFVCVYYGSTKKGKVLVWLIKSCRCDMLLMLSFEFVAICKEGKEESEKAEEEEICIRQVSRRNFEFAPWEEILSDLMILATKYLVSSMKLLWGCARMLTRPRGSRWLLVGFLVVSWFGLARLNSQWFSLVRKQ